MDIPNKCINCIHHRIAGDIEQINYCNYIERETDIGALVPYPYFFKEEYPCKGQENIK